MNSSFNDEFRNKCVLFLEREIESPYSRNIEKSIYNHTIQIARDKNIYCSWRTNKFKKLYLSKLRAIYSNLKSDSYIHNINFKKKILDGTLNHTKISELSTYDIFPENWKDLFDAKEKRDARKNEFKPEAMTDTFKCRKCSSRKCSYYEVQTRSADEPMTQFINCLDCGNRWRQ